MKKYYIGFFVLLGLCVVALGYTVSQASAAKQDRATDQAVEQVAEHMDLYTANHGGPPPSLSDAGIKNIPTTVSYQKLSSSQYKICFDYHTASSGFDAGWASLLTGGITGSTQPASSSDGSYFDTSVETSHKKGQNCQTVTPYSGSNLSPYIDTGTDSSSTSSACFADTSGYLASGTLTVASVDQAASKITFSPDNQYVYDNKGNVLPTITSKTYTANTIFCDQNYSKSTVSAVRAGSSVQIYLKSASDDSIAQLYVF